MSVLVDTNVPLRHGSMADPARLPILAVLERIASTGGRPCVCAQNIVELWAVATRPLTANGQGKEPVMFRRELDRLLAGSDIVADPPELLTTWLDLCTRYQVRGRQVFDAKIVALMLACGMTQLVTLNPTDFRRFTEIELLVPGQAA